jgi:cell fate regulator YaaT (PSP1 superfamily)
MQENDNAIKSGNEPGLPAKHTVAGIRFRSCGKIYTFELEDIDAAPGSKVVVESEMGLSIGNVVTPKYIMEKTDEPLKKVLRIANEKDFEALESNRSLEAEARVFCVNRAKELNLSMKIISAETTLDKKRFIFYFTADSRIDFRELVRDLAARFKSRIEMRQIGVRDEVKLLGGIGICGRQTCCSLFLTNFEPVTIKMAKQQELSINQSKLSGICGRLMCCLGYECKEEKDVAAIHDEELITVTEEASEADLQQVDSEAVYREERRKQPEYVSGGEKRKADAQYNKPRQKDETAAPRSDKDAATDRERHSRREHHRHKRHGHVKQVPDRPVQAQPSQEGSVQKPEGEDKGKPFSRRRKFWKKKKH